MLSPQTLTALSIAALLLHAPGTSSGPGAKGPAQPEGVQDEGQGVRIEVLDAETGKAIPNAKVSRVPEIVAPVWGEFWSNASEVTNADGLAVLPPVGPNEKAIWLLVQAEGYAPLGELGFPEAGDRTTTVELERAVPAKVRLLDFRGEPLPLVYLSQCVGCGHTPDALGTFTDREGRATLHLVGKSGGDIADVTPVGHGVGTHYLYVPWEEAMQGEVDLCVEPGYTISGRVIDTDGEPVAGVAVGNGKIHRGPWTVTDGAGRFQLFGADATGWTELQIKDLTGQELGFFGPSRKGVERILRLASDLGSNERDGDKATLKVKLNVVGYAQEGKAFWQGEIPVRIWDPMTGWMMTTGAKPGVPVELPLLPGSYMAEIGGVFSPFAAEIIGPFELRHDSPPEITRVLPAIKPRELRVVGVGAAKGMKLFHSHNSWEPMPFDRVEEFNGTTTGIIDHYVAPYATAGIWVAVGGEDSRKVPFAMEPHDPYSHRAMVARRR